MRGGTLPPARRAFDSPIAIACFGLLCSPLLKWRISVSTILCALGPYFRRELLLDRDLPEDDFPRDESDERLFNERLLDDFLLDDFFELDLFELDFLAGMP